MFFLMITMLAVVIAHTSRPKAYKIESHLIYSSTSDILINCTTHYVEKMGNIACSLPFFSFHFFFLLHTDFTRTTKTFLHMKRVLRPCV